MSAVTFVIGLLIGTAFGITLMCLLIMSREGADDDLR
jgi:hypothetical protein